MQATLDILVRHVLQGPDAESVRAESVRTVSFKDPQPFTALTASRPTSVSPPAKRHSRDGDDPTRDTHSVSVAPERRASRSSASPNEVPVGVPDDTPDFLTDYSPPPSVKSSSAPEPITLQASPWVVKGVTNPALKKPRSRAPPSPDSSPLLAPPHSTALTAQTVSLPPPPGEAPLSSNGHSSRHSSGSVYPRQSRRILLPPPPATGSAPSPTVRGPPEHDGLVSRTSPNGGDDVGIFDVRVSNDQQYSVC
mmetsp:Transcript_42325/g.92026  ORF Transcript_42325/g.92026 Transcript_42325/m.92026 type:complete len:251 (-) Transcript_42325:57-809(-)